MADKELLHGDLDRQGSGSQSSLGRDPESDGFVINFKRIIAPTAQLPTALTCPCRSASAPSTSNFAMRDMSDLPPGFRFFPTDEELVVHFLHRKASCLPCQPDIIPNLDQRLFDPWELNGKALQGGNCQWYFFSHAAAPNRISPSGYWTPVGAKETVTSSGRAVGMKTTLVFYAGQAPEGIKTNWVMHEYQLIDGATSPNSISRSNGKSSSSMRRGSKKRRDLNLVVCRVYETSFFHVEENELSCLDEVFLSLDDMEEISMPK